ncbi:hypothetical protein [Rhodanobacter sp. A1T4]|jgi:hypothetical protein|uniref:hypothetical protein n=1 Tax=Rhodanobacter sp. A1T4 TaxID=2723087 RepID=UPI0016092487|nr:hypothetical protein [Rhodanobacter sp. A1T4]MBB6247889.1 hypothetical protein [Rhodanobacter sp. A1T4]
MANIVAGLRAMLVVYRRQTGENLMQRIGMAVLCLMLGACGAVAPKYTPSAENQLALRNSDLVHVNVGSIGVSSETINKATVRGGKFSTPSASFNAYLQDSIQTELSQAGLLDPASHDVIGGTMTRNDFDGSGMSVGTADLAADFWIDHDGKRIYQGQKTAHFEWKSSFAGMTAIPAAAQGYMQAVQKLVHELLADPDFQKALHK